MVAVHHLDRSESFSLQALGEGLRREPSYDEEGHTARTLVREPDLRLVLMALREGGHIPAHAAEDTAAVQVISGRIQLQLDGPRTVDLRVGELLAMPRHERHDVFALEDSVVLLTLGRRAAP